LRPNPLKPRLAAGGCAFGTMTFEFFTPGYPAICREAGAEFILYDMEHSGVGFETMKAQFAFCRGLELVPLVRVPSGDYHHIAQALDIGAFGVIGSPLCIGKTSYVCVPTTNSSGFNQRSYWTPRPGDTNFLVPPICQ
jgi:2-keto-3-deoxy-L-rhamnonate aldolase RhmA